MKISIKNKDLLLAKKRLNERNLNNIKDDNKEDYFKSILNNYLEGNIYTLKAMETYPLLSLNKTIGR